MQTRRMYAEYRKLSAKEMEHLRENLMVAMAQIVLILEGARE